VIRYGRVVVIVGALATARLWERKGGREGGIVPVLLLLLLLDGWGYNHRFGRMGW